MKEFAEKVPYVAPNVKVVSFKVEMGVTQSGEIEVRQNAQQSAFDMEFYMQQMQQGANGNFTGAQFGGTGNVQENGTWFGGGEYF